MTVDTLLALWFDAAWQATLVAGVALVFARLAWRTPAAIRHAVLAIALLKFVTPPIAFFPGGLFALMPRPHTIAAATAAGGAPIPSAFSWMPWLVAAYVAGVACVGGAIVTSTIRLMLMRRGARPPSDATRQLATALAEHVGLRRSVAIAVSDAAAAPIAIGMVSPAVLVPETMEHSLDPVELRAVLAHELAHHRHHHLAWAWIRSAGCALWWWHPAVWMVSRGLRHVQEELCDDEVIRAGRWSATRTATC